MEVSIYADTVARLIYYLDYYGLYYAFGVNAFFALLVILSFPQIYKRFIELNIEGFSQVLTSESLPAITLIVPVRNYEKGAVSSVRSYLHLTYPKKELIIVNDGSTDQTVEQLKNAFELYEVPQIFPMKIPSSPIKKLYRSRAHPELIVIDKEHGGKADSQNGALNICSSPLFLILDIDTIIEEDALLRMIRPFVTKRGVCGEGATIRVLNGCKVENGKIKEVHIPKSILPGIQVGEYLRAFLYGRLGWNYLGGNFIVSGAFGLFDKAKAMKVGGYDTNIVAEDMDITMSMISHFRGKGEKCFFRFIPDPMAWTEVPSTINSLGHQRERWHRGLVFVLQKHWKMFLNPRHGLTGLVAMPYLVFAEFLQPVLELTYYFAVILGFVFGVITFKYFLLFLVVVMGISLILTLSCIIMEQLTFKRYKLSAELFLLLLYATFENLGYRQFYFFWKMWGIVKAVRNVRRDEHFG